MLGVVCGHYITAVGTMLEKDAMTSHRNCVGVLGKSGLRGDGAVTELLSQVAKGMIPEF